MPRTVCAGCARGGSTLHPYRAKEPVTSGITREGKQPPQALAKGPRHSRTRRLLVDPLKASGAGERTHARDSGCHGTKPHTTQRRARALTHSNPHRETLHGLHAVYYTGGRHQAQSGTAHAIALDQQAQHRARKQASSSVTQSTKQKRGAAKGSNSRARKQCPEPRPHTPTPLASCTKLLKRPA